ncbi:MAG: hypothetical protein OEW11_09585 [Nitrospirota bacterium]|nr:hypothetical protein [Nitrospirota bacterium]
MKQLTCIRPAANPNSDLPWPTDGVIHPPHPAGVVNAGQQVALLVVEDGFDEGLLPPGWTVVERLRSDGMYDGFRADEASVARFAPTSAVRLTWIPVPMGWKP